MRFWRSTQIVKKHKREANFIQVTPLTAANALLGAMLSGGGVVALKWLCIHIDCTISLAFYLYKQGFSASSNCTLKVAGPTGKQKSKF